MDEKYNEALERAVKFYKHANQNQKEWLESIFPVLAESEEERMIDELIGGLMKQRDAALRGSKETDCVLFGFSISANTIIAYLKDKQCVLLEKHKEQQPVEWSEKDEEMRQRVIDTLKTVLSIRDEDDPIFAGSEMVRWIKNLHLQYKLIDEDRIKSVLPPQWKPSEEQMKVLKEAVFYFGDCWVSHKQEVLESLYNDLKKLM